MSTNKEFDYGKSMAELEKLVAELESDELSIDTAIKKFEQGAKLSAELQDYLKKAQLKINQIKANLDDVPESDD